MLCEKCNKNEARVHLVKMVNGKKSETWLCESCAKEISNGALIPLMVEEGDKDISKTIESLFNNISPEKQTPLPKIDFICKNCGITLSKFKKTGKLGCGECYDSFNEEIEKIMIEFQGSTEHRGKTPIRKKQKLNKLSEIDKLEKELKKAIEVEEYKLAIVLRDKLKIVRGEYHSNGK